MNVQMSLEKFPEQFNNEESCIEYLVRVRWPNGFECPQCHHAHAYRITSRRLPLFECSSCHHQTSLTVGTVMEGSHTKLSKWLTALWLVSRTSIGVNAVQLSKIIKVTYKTAWLMLHKIRHAIGEADASVLLSGLVQVNETKYGKPPYTSNPKDRKDHPVVIAASHNDQNELQYIKIKLVNKAYLVNGYSYIIKKWKEEFTRQHVETGNKVDFVLGRYTLRKYKKLLPLFTGANEWIKNTFHGLGSRYLDTYFNEYCYRVNLKLKNVPIFGSLTDLCMKSRAISFAF